jgi:hypothetical protein
MQMRPHPTRAIGRVRAVPLATVKPETFVTASETSPMLCHLIRALLDHGANLIPIDGRKVPLIKGWRELASSDPSTVEGWRRQWPYCGFGWTLPAAIVVTDLDMKCGQNGIADFRRIDRRDPHEVVTPTSTSPTGGLHLYWATAGRSFKNIRLPGTSVDIKCKGGFIGVPDIIDSIGNGREWLPGRHRGKCRYCQRRHGWMQPCAMSPYARSRRRPICHHRKTIGTSPARRWPEPASASPMRPVASRTRPGMRSASSSVC